MAVAEKIEAQRAMLERRRQVADLRLAGVKDQVQIAKVLEVDRSTISRDLKALDAEYRQVARQAIQTEKGRDLERLEQMIRFAWEPMKDKTLSYDIRLKAIQTVNSLLERRAKILGYDAPTRLDHRFEQWTEEQLEVYILGTIPEELEG